MVVVWVRLPHLVQQTLLTPLTIVLLIINSLTGEASGNIMSQIQTRTGLMIEAILLRETIAGSIWFAQDRLIATDKNNVEIESNFSSFDIANIMDNLYGEIVKSSIEFVVSRINPDYSLTELGRSKSIERIKTMYFEFLSLTPDGQFVIISEPLVI